MKESDLGVYDWWHQSRYIYVGTHWFVDSRALLSVSRQPGLRSEFVHFQGELFPSLHGCINYEGHPERKERLRMQSAHLFCCSRSLVSGVQCDVENCLMQLYVGPCHVVSAQITVAIAVPIENPTDCEVRGVISFLQSDEIVGYLAEEESSRVEFFCCTTMHVRILPGRHKPCCMSNSIETSSSILRTVRTWHRRTFPVSKNEGTPFW